VKFQCPSCKTLYDVPDGKLSGGPKQRVTCRKCKQEIPLGGPACETPTNNEVGGGTQILLAGALDLMRQAQADALAARDAASTAPSRRTTSSPAAPTTRAADQSLTSVVDAEAEAPSTRIMSAADLARMREQALLPAASGQGDATSTLVTAAADPVRLRAHAAPLGTAASRGPEASSAPTMPVADVARVPAHESPAAPRVRHEIDESPTTRVMSASEMTDLDARDSSVAKRVTSDAAVIARPGAMSWRDRVPHLSRSAWTLGGIGFVGGVFVGVAATLLFTSSSPQQTMPAATPAVVAATATAALDAPAQRPQLAASDEGAVPTPPAPAAAPAAKGGSGKPAAKGQAGARALGLSDPESDGCLAVNTVPSASVLLGGVIVGTAPAKCVELPAGVQRITLEVANTGQREEVQVIIKAGRVTRLSHNF